MGSPQFVLSQSPSHTFGKRREFSISKKGEISYFVHMHLMLIARGTFIGSKFMHILSVLRHKWIYQTSIFNSPSSFLESDSINKRTLHCVLWQGKTFCRFYINLLVSSCKGMKHLWKTTCWVNKVWLTSPLTPRSEQHVASPKSIHTFSGKQVVRILKLTRYKILSWWNTNFS